MTSTLEQSTPRTARYGLAALLPLALAGLIITAVLTVLVGVIGLVIGLVVTAVAVVVRARTFDTGLDAAILRDLGAANGEEIPSPAPVDTTPRSLHLLAEATDTDSPAVASVPEAAPAA